MKFTFFSPGRADWAAISEVLREMEYRSGVTVRVAAASDFEFIRGEARREGLTSPIISLGAETKVATGADATMTIARVLQALLDEVRAHPPDCILVSGDRYELLGVLAVAVPERIPIAHISGGECTFGAIDE